MLRMLKNNDVSYKIFISCLLGALGFLINLYPLATHLREYSINLFAGFVFVIIVAFAWGLRYAIISGIISSSALLILGDKVTLLSSYFLFASFFLWILWHSFSMNLFKRKKYAMYLAEIPFRLLFIGVVLLGLKYGGYSSFVVKKQIIDFAPMFFSNYIILESVINAYLILLLAHVFLNFKFINKIFRLREEEEIETTFIIGSSLILGVLFWIINSFWGYYLFDQRVKSLLFQAPLFVHDSFFRNVPADDFFVRVCFLVACLIQGIFIVDFLKKSRKIKNSKLPVAKFRKKNEVREQVSKIKSKHK